MQMPNQTIEKFVIIFITLFLELYLKTILKKYFVMHYSKSVFLEI